MAANGGMMASRSDDIVSGLRSLGAHGSELPAAGPSWELLEAFPNRHSGRNYVVSLAFPEFTSLCPVTGQPDFGTIRVEYIPADLCVESKSFKLYMFAYRGHQSFMETITNNILDDLVKVLRPRWCQVAGLFAPRGATQIHVFCEHYERLPPDDDALLRRAVRDWRLGNGVRGR